MAYYDESLARRIRYLRHAGGGLWWDEIAQELGIDVRLVRRLYNSMPPIEHKRYKRWSELADDECRYTIMRGLYCAQKVLAGSDYCMLHTRVVGRVPNDWRQELEADLERAKWQDGPITGWERNR